MWVLKDKKGLTVSTYCTGELYPAAKNPSKYVNPMTRDRRESRQSDVCEEYLFLISLIILLEDHESGIGRTI